MIRLSCHSRVPPTWDGTVMHGSSSAHQVSVTSLGKISATAYMSGRLVKRVRATSIDIRNFTPTKQWLGQASNQSASINRPNFDPDCIEITFLLTSCDFYW